MLVSRVSAPIRRETVRNLRKAITEGKFLPGERLVERGLCELMGVSRTSVREALRQLETEGLIQLVNHRGPIVAVVTPEEAKQIYEVRQMLEALACSLFAERASDSDIRSLNALLLRLEKISKTGDIKEFLRVKNRLYSIILRGCGNNLVYYFIRSLHSRVMFLRYTSLSQPGRCKKSFREVKAIVKAIEKRDPQSAWTLCVDHILRAKAAALSALPDPNLQLPPDNV